MPNDVQIDSTTAAARRYFRRVAIRVLLALPVVVGLFGALLLHSLLRFFHSYFGLEISFVALFALLWLAVLVLCLVGLAFYWRQIHGERLDRERGDDDDNDPIVRFQRPDGLSAGRSPGSGADPVHPRRNSGSVVTSERVTVTGVLSSLAVRTWSGVLTQPDGSTVIVVGAGEFPGAGAVSVVARPDGDRLVVVEVSRV